MATRRARPQNQSKGDMVRQYLIRWEGYGPDDDTWELRRDVTSGSRELVALYESQREFWSAVVDDTSL